MRGTWRLRRFPAKTWWRTRRVARFMWRCEAVPEVIMPKMGDAMEEGTLLKWLKSEGDEAEEGQDVAVGEAIAFIQGEGEEVPEQGGQEAEGEAEAEGGGEAQAQTATE